jgi:predicted nucleotidyltransferase
MANQLDEMVEKLRKALNTSADSSLVSVVLYGSAATGEFNEKFSDFNLLCILTKLTPAELRAVEPLFRWWREKGNPSPLLLTEHELKTSTDCFPIEFTDIREHHRILFGPNLVEGLEIDRSFYRAQVECQLRTKLLRLRQKGGGLLSDKDALRRLLAESVSTFCVLIRHALLLDGVPVTVPRRVVVDTAARHFGIDASPFLTLLDLREQKLKAKEVEPEPLFGRYMIQIDKVIDAVDVLAK